MRLQSMLPNRPWLALGLILTTITSVARADDGNGGYQQYCSSQNTGADYAGVVNIYNSNGACSTQCRANYAFAIVQWQSCWCSNIVPSSQQNTAACNQNCPGYPADKCGNANRGLYGYIALDNAPSGTDGASSSQASSTSASPTQVSSTAQPIVVAPTTEATTEDPPTSAVSITIVQTVTQDPSWSVLVSYDHVTPTQAPSQPPPSSSTSTPSIENTTPVVVALTPASTSSSQAPAPVTKTVPEPVTSTRVVTLSGAVVTQYVTSTPSPVIVPGTSPAAQRFQRKENLGGGAIAGIVIGSIIGLALLALVAAIFWRRRKNAGDAASEVGAAGFNPKRNVSVLSKAGLISRARPETAEREDDGAYYGSGATGNNSTRHSMLFGPGAEVSPVSPLGSSHDADSRRHSKPLVYDQRLNPSALFMNQEGNGSRVSMQDMQDYSRPLGIANPDPRASFESRISRR